MTTLFGSSRKRQGIFHSRGSGARFGVTDVWTCRHDSLLSRDLQSLVSQLNLWTPHIELALQELRGAHLVLSGQMQRLIESTEIELMKVTVSFRNELDTRAAEKTQSDERLKQDIYST